MRGFASLAIAAIVAIGFTATPARAEAQVGVEVGVAPVCPYGYYGPEWFSGGVFIGTGPWFHGPENFRGHVNNHFHPEHGYKGAYPARGEKADPAKHVDAAHFKGNEMRDGHGHVVKR